MFLVDSLTDEELRERVVELFPLLNDICANKVQSERRQDYGKRQTRKDIVEQATANLNDNAHRAEILGALERDQEAVEAGLTVQAGRFTAQQLRDKFRSIRRGKK